MAENFEWAVVQDWPIIKEIGMTEAEWVACGWCFEGKTEKTEVQEVMKRCPELSQLCFAAHDRMGWGYTMMGDIVKATETAMTMSKMRVWALEVGLELKLVVHGHANDNVFEAMKLLKEMLDA